jgi:hypothetical protein
MNEPTTYEIVIRGRANARVLHPLLDDFVCEHLDHRAGDRVAGRAADQEGNEGVTRLVGVVYDPAHLHGVVAHLTSMNAELISIAPLASPDVAAKNSPTTQQERTTTS